MNETKNIPVIALTADTMDSDIKKALDIGFKGYITKPIDVSKFLTMIDEFFKLREHGNWVSRNQKIIGCKKHGKNLQQFNWPEKKPEK